jgi:uncharacterized oxidoreductase
MKLLNKTILVTGGSSGIGLEFARQLIKKQNKVIITGRDLRRLEKAKQELPELEIIQSDVSAASDLPVFYETVTSKYPELSVLINNAGVGRTIDLKIQQNLSDLSQEVEINFQGPVNMVNQFLPHLMKREEALIVNVTSALAFSPFPVVPIYSATKAALHSYTKSLRMQLRKSPVKVVEVAPPTTQTTMIDGFGSDRLKGVKIMSTQDMVTTSIDGIESEQSEICPGQASKLRFMSRLAPNFILRQMSGK